MDMSKRPETATRPDMSKRPEMATRPEMPEYLVAAEYLQAEDTDVRNADRTRNQVRRRAIGDALLVLLGTAAVTTPVASPHDSLMVGIAAVSVGIMFFLIRRNSDIAAIARANRWRDRRLDGRGISLAQWHQGAALSSWTERRRAEQPGR